MTMTTYAGLKTVIADRLNRDDVIGNVDDFIVAAEQHFNRMLRLPDMITMNTAFAVTSRYTALPTGFLAMERVMTTTPRRAPLEFIAPEAVSRFDDGTDSLSTPTQYSIVGLNLELLNCTSATLELSYYKRLVSIIGSPNTNAVLELYSDLYLWRSCLEGALRVRDTRRVQDYQTQYDRVLLEANRASKRARYGVAMAVKAV